MQCVDLFYFGSGGPMSGIEMLARELAAETSAVHINAKVIQYKTLISSLILIPILQKFL